jgi:hypothetical protein
VGALKKISPSGGRREHLRLLVHFTKLPKHTYTRPEEADVTSLLNSICNFDFVVTIVVVQMCLAFKKGLSRSLDLD